MRQRASSPKLQVLNTSLMSAQLPYSFAEAQKTPDIWGHLVESAVGAHLMNTTLGSDIDIFYWRENQQEVDFILQKGDKLVALEVKSGARKMALPGITAFQTSFPHARVFLIGGQGLSIEKFLTLSPQEFFKAT